MRRGAVSLVRSHREVLDECTGLSGFGWRAARTLYRSASSNRVVRNLYQRLRRDTDHEKPGLAHRVLGSQLREKFLDSNNPLIVSHPALVGILAGRSNVLYQHGELVAPGESLVSGASTVFVPTAEVAQKFHAIGYSPEQVVVTGLCIEPAISKQAKDFFSARMSRLEVDGELCGLFISSGAEPADHVDYLAKSAVCVATNGGKAVIAAPADGRLQAHTERLLSRAKIDACDITTSTSIPNDLPSATIVLYRTRRELDTLTSLLFGRFDYFVAPAHERVNWAVGLGLPMIALEPTTGPFAPLNLDLVTGRGVAVRSSELGRADTFHWNINRFRREGRLFQMAKAGWGAFPINGFDVVAGELISRYGTIER